MMRRRGVVEEGEEGGVGMGVGEEGGGRRSRGRRNMGGGGRVGLGLGGDVRGPGGLGGYGKGSICEKDETCLFCDFALGMEGRGCTLYLPR